MSDESAPLIASRSGSRGGVFLLGRQRTQESDTSAQRHNNWKISRTREAATDAWVQWHAAHECRQLDLHQGGSYHSPRKLVINGTSSIIFSRVNFDTLMWWMLSLSYQQFSFYDLIVTKARGKSGPLFHFDVHDDIRWTFFISFPLDLMQRTYADWSMMRVWKKMNHILAKW